MLTIDIAFRLLESLKWKEVRSGADPEFFQTFFENHVFGSSNAAYAIASKLPHMNANRMRIAGLLHDIAKTEEIKLQRHHGVVGYEMFKDADPDIARACLLHMFPLHILPAWEEVHETFFNKKEDYDLVHNYINKHAITDEDRLISLCDDLANKDGIVTLEERKREIEERRKTPYKKYPLYLELKEHFDKKLVKNTGMDVYEILGLAGKEQF